MLKIFLFRYSNVWSAVVTLLLNGGVLRTMKCISSLRGIILHISGMMTGTLECRSVFECRKSGMHDGVFTQSPY